MEDRDVLISFYEQEFGHAQHHESQRTAMSNLILLISVMAIGLVTYDKELSSIDTYPAAALLVLGIFGALFSIKLTERARLHFMRARILRKEVDRISPNLKIAKLFKKAVFKHKKRGVYSSCILNNGLEKWWILFHTCISIIGVAILLGIYGR